MPSSAPVVTSTGAVRGEAPAQAMPRPVYDAYDLAQRIHTRVNEARASLGIEPVEYDAYLALVAERHSADMAARDYFSHTGEGDTRPNDRAKAMGYECEQQVGDIVLEGISENLFKTTLWEWYEEKRDASGLQRTYHWTDADGIAAETVKEWLASPGHRTNLLKSTHRVEGIGVAFTDDDRVYITQNFC